MGTLTGLTVVRWDGERRPVVRPTRSPGRHRNPASWPDVWHSYSPAALAGGTVDSDRLVSARRQLGRDGLAHEEASHVRRCADAALDRAPDGRPVLVVGKSLGTLALPWAVENGLPGAWLTPLLQDAAVVTAVQEAQQPTLLVGGTADPHWHHPRRPARASRFWSCPVPITFCSSPVTGDALYSTRSRSSTG